jgi:hypothetical protein
MIRGARSTLLLVLAFAACSGAQGGKVLDRGPEVVAPKVPPLIKLERGTTGACPARCPQYSLEIDVEGRVAYDGVLNVKTIGPATGQLSQEAVQQLRTLMAKARQAGFPTDRCACGCMEDVASVKLTTWEKKAPRTVAYHDACDRVPHAVRVLEAAVDDLAGIEHWIGTIQQRRLCFQEQRDCTGFGTPKPPKRPEPDAGR